MKIIRWGILLNLDRKSWAEILRWQQWKSWPSVINLQMICILERRADHPKFSQKPNVCRNILLSADHKVWQLPIVFSIIPLEMLTFCPYPSDILIKNGTGCSGGIWCSRNVLLNVGHKVEQSYPQSSRYHWTDYKHSVQTNATYSAERWPSQV